jgi:hypothetical protein
MANMSVSSTLIRGAIAHLVDAERMLDAVLDKPLIMKAVALVAEAIVELDEAISD